MKREFEQIHSGLTASFLDKFLAAFSYEVVWRWTLEVQDELVFPPELEYLSKALVTSKYPHGLNVAWGKPGPLVSRQGQFPFEHLVEVGLPIEYCWGGSSIAQKIIKDIQSEKRLRPKFNWIRLHIVAQMVRHHGVLLGYLRERLEDRGVVWVVDSKDDHLQNYPLIPKITQLYADLKEAQKAAGGLRTATERILKRGSVFGFNLKSHAALPIRTATEQQNLDRFRIYCLHIELLSRAFGNLDRIALFQEALDWVNSPGCWSEMGIEVVALEKKTVRAKKRSRSRER